MTKDEALAQLQQVHDLLNDVNLKKWIAKNYATTSTGIAMDFASLSNKSTLLLKKINPVQY